MPFKPARAPRAPQRDLAHSPGTMARLPKQSQPRAHRHRAGSAALSTRRISEGHRCENRGADADFRSRIMRQQQFSHHERGRLPLRPCPLISRAAGGPLSVSDIRRPPAGSCQRYIQPGVVVYTRESSFS